MYLQFVVDHINLSYQKPSEATWLIGEGVFTKAINAKGLRTFKHELAYDDKIIGKDPQPQHMLRLQELTQHRSRRLGWSSYKFEDLKSYILSILHKSRKRKRGRTS